MDRRRFLLVATAAAGVTALAAAWRNGRPDTTVRSGGRQGEPKLSSRGGVLEASIEASPVMVSLGDRRANLYGFNGRVPGPVLEVRPGDTLRLRLVNRLPEATNLHYHGLHVPPTGKADNIFLEIPSGESFDYEFTVPSSHPAGLFWYHPHLHGSVARHVGRGMAGTLVVRGELDAVPEVAAAREEILVLEDFSLDADGDVLEPGMMERMQGREGELVTVNAESRRVLTIEKGGLLRLRLLNASPSRFYRLAIEEHPLHLIGTDGGGIPAPVSIDELLLVPGERADLLVQGDKAEGTFRLLARPYDRLAGMGGMMGMMGRGRMGGRMGRTGGGMGRMGRGGGGQEVPGAALTLATLRYEGAASRPLGLPSRLVTVDSLPAPSRVRRLTLSMGMGMGMSFLIDGREFDHDRIDSTVRLDEVEDWEYVNNTPMDHPMHLHTNPFQAVTGGIAERRWRDVLLVRANASARMRVAFRDFPGRTVHHCHILDHEDMGMMATVQMEA